MPNMVAAQPGCVDALAARPGETVPVSSGAIASNRTTHASTNGTRSCVPSSVTHPISTPVDRERRSLPVGNPPDRLSPVPRQAFVELVAMLTGATMAKVSDCLRMLYEL